MDLFQSGRKPWPDPYPYIWKQYARMSDWFQELPQNMLPSVKSCFELELLYSYVYILSPSPRIPHIHEYAQRLIFEHCIAYATNLLFIINQPLNTTRPPLTFYDAMRAYMTGRQFVDVLSRNMDTLLSPHLPVSPTPFVSQPESEDPLAPPIQVSAPPFPSPSLPEGQMVPPDPVVRAIGAIDDFTSILSKFGLRFGFIHWRDRFQRESASLSAQLHQRNSMSPQTSPPMHQVPPPVVYPPQWIAVSSVSPQPPQLVYQDLPTTPPTPFPPQSSPYSSSLSYNGNPFDGLGTSPLQPTLSYDAAGQNCHLWTTPSPQPVPDMPQPTEGRKRQAIVYGPGLPPESRQNSSSAPVRPQGNGWNQPLDTWSQAPAVQEHDSIAWN